MIERLRAQWHPDISFAEIIELRDELDRILQQIRSQRHIRPSVLKCPKCGQISEGAQPEVSVRATILSVIRFNIAAEEPTRAIEKSWAAYRTRNTVDLYGKVVGLNPGGSGCDHGADKGTRFPEGP